MKIQLLPACVGLLSLALLGACGANPTQAAGALGGVKAKAAKPIAAPKKAAKPIAAPKTAPKALVGEDAVQPINRIPTPIPKQPAVTPKGGSQALIGEDATHAIPTPIP